MLINILRPQGGCRTRCQGRWQGFRGCLSFDVPMVLCVSSHFTFFGLCIWWISSLHSRFIDVSGLPFSFFSPLCIRLLISFLSLSHINNHGHIESPILHIVSPTHPHSLSQFTVVPCRNSCITIPFFATLSSAPSFLGVRQTCKKIKIAIGPPPSAFPLPDQRSVLLRANAGQGN